MSVDERFAAQLSQLRSEFDRSFAVAPSTEERREVALLVLRIGDDRMAVRLSEITGLLACRNLVSVPSRASELLGIVGVRGGLVPVFSLARLTGHGHDVEPPRWLLLCGSELGLGFAHFEGHIRAPAHAMQAVDSRDSRPVHFSHVCTLGEVATPVISVPSVLRALAERTKES